MNTTRKFWMVLIGAILGMAVIACSCGSTTPTPTAAPPPATVHPLPGLEGNWQWADIVFTIAWQNNQYVVTSINAAGTSKRTLTSQSWDGSRLTWTYHYTDENSNNDLTYTTVAVNGNELTTNYSNSGGTPSQHLLKRVPSAAPAYSSLPYSDDFSNPASGWDSYTSDSDQAGYGNGFYFVTSKTKSYSSYGSSGRFFGDTVIAVDATPVSGPADNNFSYYIGCRTQDNSDGYLFEISGDGYFAAGYYTAGGKTYATLLTGNEWQPSSAIRKGKVMNHLAVTCAGDQFKMEVNGQVVYQGQDSTFPSGDVSLGTGTHDDNSTPTEVDFTNLSVTAP